MMSHAAMLSALARPETPPTLHELWQDYTDSLEARGSRSLGTFRSCAPWVLGPLGPLRVDAITPRALHVWLAALAETPARTKRRGEPERRKLSAGTVHNAFGCVASVLSHGVALGVLAQSPCKAARRWLPRKVEIADTPGETRTRRRSLPLQDLVRLCVSPEIPAVLRVEFTVAMLTGARVSEIRALRFDDVALNADVPHIVIARSWHRQTTKTGEARRVPLHPVLRNVLRDWRAWGWRQAIGRDPRDGDVLFPSRRGLPHAPHGVDAVRRYLARLGLPPMTYHGFRHSLGDALADAGATDTLIASLLGHTRPGTTARYARPSLAACADALARVQVDLLRPFAEPSFRGLTAHARIGSTREPTSRTPVQERPHHMHPDTQNVIATTDPVTWSVHWTDADGHHHTVLAVATPPKTTEDTARALLALLRLAGITSARAIGGMP